ncbi:MAG: DUF1640 domain-containing protein [Candidatus Kuenenia sp.]|nr:DUF1640 domain-containing protein [Candidatus Kuenenia hertensis]
MEITILLTIFRKYDIFLSMAIITIPKILTEKLSEEGANALVEILDKVEDRSEAHTLQVAEERFEKKLEQTKSEIKEEISKVDLRIEQTKTELREEINKVDLRIEQTKTELGEEINKVDLRIEQTKTELKEEINKVDLRIEQTKTELKEEINKVDLRIEQTKTELREEINRVDKRIEQVKSELKEEITNTRADLIKWMFIFWIGQFASIVGVITAILFAFFKP